MEAIPEQLHSGYTGLRKRFGGGTVTGGWSWWWGMGMPLGSSQGRAIPWGGYVLAHDSSREGVGLPQGGHPVGGRVHATASPAWNRGCQQDKVGCQHRADGARERTGPWIRRWGLRRALTRRCQGGYRCVEERLGGATSGAGLSLKGVEKKEQGS